MFWNRNAAKKFMPHPFENRVEMSLGTPCILVTRDAYEDMHILVDEVDKEVGWLGTVEKVGLDYLVKEVFLFDQETHATTTEITPDGLAQFATDMITNRQDGMEVVNAIRFWGHSHVDMGTSPSGQDEDQMNTFRENGCEYFVRGILNKAGRMEFTLFLYDIGVVIRDCEWHLYEPADNARRARWQGEIKTKVREKVMLPLSTGYGSWNDWYRRESGRPFVESNANGNGREVFGDD